MQSNVNAKVSCFQRIDSLLNDPVFATSSTRGKKLRSLFKVELTKAIMEGDYKHLLHAEYIKAEMERVLDYHLGKEIDLMHLHQLSIAAKYIDHEQYLRAKIYFTDHIEVAPQRLSVLLELQKYARLHDIKIYDIPIKDRIASAYFKMSNFSSAKIYWSKCASLVKVNSSESVTSKASFLNNVAVIYDASEQHLNALKINDQALRLMKSNKMDNEKFGFYYALLANRAYYYKCLNKLEDAHNLFEKVFYYRLNSPNEIQYLAPTAQQLLSIKIALKKTTQNLIKDVVSSYSNANSSQKELFYPFFIEYYQKVKDFKNAFKFYKLYSDNDYSKSEKKIEQILQINKELEKEKLDELKASTSARNQLEKSKLINLILFLTLIVAISAITLIFRWRIYHQKTKFIHQEKEMEAIKKAVIENELKLQREQNMQLELNLAVKGKSEAIFLEKLKEIRRKKQHDPEEIIKELQFQIMNLLQIDEKSISKRKKTESTSNEFVELLKNLDKNLSDHEIQLCSYFKMNLSAKEIVQLEPQISVTSVRTIKNRIKRKLGLGPEDNLHAFLDGLIV